MQNSSFPRAERVHTVVIGGGQSGLSVGYHLTRRGLPFVILDANERIGDAWRKRWDSLRLFTPARYDGLAGMPFPAPAGSFPTKNEMADFLEAYARHFNLPVRTGVRVDRLTREGRTYTISAGPHRFEAEHVVVAMSSYQQPKVPAFSKQLDKGIVQLHSVAYRNPAQLDPGGVLMVGAGNSGAEIAVELVRHGHKVWMSGNNTGEVPFRIENPVARNVLVPIVFRVLFHRIMTIRTPIGRMVRPRFMKQGTPLIRVKYRDLKAAGVERVPRMEGVRDGKPLMEDGRVLDVANVIWSTGFHAGLSWIDLPIVEADGEPRHTGGLVDGEPGLYFVGLHFLYSLSSTMIHGVARDASRIVDTIAARTRAEATATSVHAVAAVS